MKCPNKNCRAYKKGMENLSPSNHNYCNYICLFCKCHYYGDIDSPKFYSKEEWENWVNVVDGIDLRIELKKAMR